jgi:hypothetical protein
MEIKSENKVQSSDDESNPTLEKKACIVIDDNNKANHLEDENKLLKEKVEKLNTTLTKFIQGSKILETMLSSQRYVFNKKRFKLSI